MAQRYMTLKEFLLALLGGGVAVTLVEIVKEAIAWHRNRKAQLEDREEEERKKNTEERIRNLETAVEKVEKMVMILLESQKNSLFDRITHLCKKYIADGQIDVDDLRALKMLYRSYHGYTDDNGVYHEGVGGNGDLEDLMKIVEKLPLKDLK